MMKAGEKEQVRRDIAEAFDFIRFIVKNPAMLGKIKNGSQIRFVPAVGGKRLKPLRQPKKVQTFAAETVFRSL